MEDQEFADDIALFTHILQDIRCKTEDLKATGEKVVIKMNVPKTKLMKVVTKQDGTVNIGQESVEEVEEFQYLGSKGRVRWCSFPFSGRQETNSSLLVLPLSVDCIPSGELTKSEIIPMTTKLCDSGGSTI